MIKTMQSRKNFKRRDSFVFESIIMLCVRRKFKSKLLKKIFENLPKCGVQEKNSLKCFD